MPIIKSILLTSQDPMSWLKDSAARNISLIYVTLLTSQDPIFYSKDIQFITDEIIFNVESQLEKK